VSPETATFSKAAAADVVLTVTAATNATLTALKNSGATVNSSNYTYASGTLTIKKEYLTTLANGAKTFTVTMSSGDDLTVTITVAD
jgi:hypothetical protein